MKLLAAILSSVFLLLHATRKMSFSFISLSTTFILSGIVAQRLSVALQCGRHTPHQPGTAPAHNRPVATQTAYANNASCVNRSRAGGRKILSLVSCYNGRLFHNH
jgi:hypothetical protein